jgi:hypothetical protein
LDRCAPEPPAGTNAQCSVCPAGYPLPTAFHQQPIEFFALADFNARVKIYRNFLPQFPLQPVNASVGKFLGADCYKRFKKIIQKVFKPNIV